MNEADFLQIIHSGPKDDTTLLIYADWLEEQSDPVSMAKAEFVRLTVIQSVRTGTTGQRKVRRKRLQQLAAALDTRWLAVVSRLAIESCQGKARDKSQRPHLITFEYRCDRRWEDLRTTDDKAVRFCDSCQHNVHFCDTITEAREHAWAGHCIAVDLGVIRRKEDLEPERHWLGRPSAETLRQEQERIQPDAVSAARERQKHILREGEKSTEATPSS